MPEVALLPYLTYPTLVLMSPLTYLLTGNTWAFVFIAFGIIPTVDAILPVDTVNPTKEEQSKMAKKKSYRHMVYIAAIVEIAVWLWGLHVFATAELNVYQRVGFILSHGIFGAAGFNVAHELFHKISNKFEVILGNINMIPMLYLHFYVEHVWGHHKNVATPGDPASSRRNETLYAFLPRTLVGGFKSAWNLEAERLKKEKKSVYSLENRHFTFFLVYIVALTATYHFYGTLGLTYYLLVALNSVIYLETINYVEHYALTRKEIKPGVYEPVDIRHSWNCTQSFSNWILFRLQRHSDHHENALKPYQNLCSYEDSPTLPQGYPLCIIMSLYPKVWFEMAHGVLKKYHELGKTPAKIPMKVRSVVNKTIFWSFSVSFAVTAGCSAYNAYA
mmetsp:Transcript_44169/g.50831  ORF Transcript_44169/g.50831 Transcript_44169/m.50831 type:complete len:389 (+) Transcript_44169:307-1473(+)